MALSIAVFGDGGWGTTLALHCHRLGHHVIWWSAFPQYAALFTRRRENVKFLPGVRIPRTLAITSDPAEALHAARIAILAVPSQHLRTVARRLRPMRRQQIILVSAAKGLERGTLKRMSEVLAEETGRGPFAVLSGPNIAAEIARGKPASSVIASPDRAVALEIQRALMDERLRIYTSTDVAGVELGGALKNPIAIAAGVADGLELGSNSKAAIITRGIVEMARLGRVLGGRQRTFWGLSGLGDLITTCLSGRNHWLGEQMGMGRSAATVLRSTPMVIEGVETSKAALALARRHRVELPIIEQVYAMLFRRRSPRLALQTLMRRAGKSEA
jgi:glycerol-3-phosphate dehydrogenase (NAD(P)+)